MTVHERVEIVPHRNYWHGDDGARWAHHYDGRWHWYGFYSGPRFYWTRYHWGRWWWWDAYYGRWVFWWDGLWWWPGPAGAVYIYGDDGYRPYGYVPAGPEPVPPAPVQGTTTLSADGRRMVQVVGAQGQAFLYDKSEAEPVYMRFLGKGVGGAKFGGGTAGEPLRLTLEFKDGRTAVFDADGKELSAPSVPADQLPGPPPGAPPPVPAE